jgi:hypothetical protein
MPLGHQSERVGRHTRQGLASRQTARRPRDSLRGPRHYGGPGLAPHPTPAHAPCQGKCRPAAGPRFFLVRLGCPDAAWSALPPDRRPPDLWPGALPGRPRPPLVAGPGTLWQVPARGAPHEVAKTLVRRRENLGKPGHFKRRSGFAQEPAVLVAGERRIRGGRSAVRPHRRRGCPLPAETNSPKRMPDHRLGRQSSSPTFVSALR